MLPCRVAFAAVLIIPVLSHRYRNYDPESWCDDDSLELTVYQPKGLKITAACRRGITSMDLTGKFGGNEVRAPLYRTFIRRHKRKWTFDGDDITLNIGDRVNFELYATNRWDIIRTVYKGQLEVKERFDRGCESCSNPVLIEKPPTTTTSTTMNPLEANLQVCHEAVVNSTKDVIELRSRVERLTKKNQLLLRAFENTFDAKRLTLNGVIPPDGTAKEVVAFVLWEKLDLQPQIVSAVRNDTGLITFEVETVEEKLEILEEAEDGLKGSRMKIS